MGAHEHPKQTLRERAEIEKSPERRKTKERRVAMTNPSPVDKTTEQASAQESDIHCSPEAMALPYLTDRSSLEQWFDFAQRRGYRYLLICADTFHFWEPPDYYWRAYHTLEEAREFADRQLTGIDQLMDVFDLELTFAEQVERPAILSLDEIER